MNISLYLLTECWKLSSLILQVLQIDSFVTDDIEMGEETPLKIWSTCSEYPWCGPCSSKHRYWQSGPSCVPLLLLIYKTCLLLSRLGKIVTSYNDVIQDSSRFTYYTGNCTTTTVWCDISNTFLEILSMRCFTLGFFFLINKRPVSRLDKHVMSLYDVIQYNGFTTKLRFGLWCIYYYLYGKIIHYYKN